MLSRNERLFRSELLDWAAENTREFPWRDPNRPLYEIFVAEFFLTQTPAENVATVYPQFIEQFPSLRTIEDSNEDELIELIEPLGFYNMRAEALKEIASRYEKLPDDPEELIELPQVGRYVANATVCIALGRPLPLLDRNVVRIYERVFAERWPSSEADQLDFAERLVPSDNARTYNLALLDFGAAICQPNPRCSVCFAKEYCKYYQFQK